MERLKRKVRVLSSICTSYYFIFLVLNILKTLVLLISSFYVIVFSAFESFTEILVSSIFQNLNGVEKRKILSITNLAKFLEILADFNLSEINLLAKYTKKGDLQMAITMRFVSIPKFSTNFYAKFFGHKLVISINIILLPQV